ncbi:uncharacterized protein LOC132797235 isoform X1 [Drosophila nasuta]|uniref:uncharacterized protein LOC132797235 isoform X1 n=2 Tax=Drosophila nasuta TaxID=42062 RepID=UPI00295F3161|nr:uncharacterized protein LOC132797235 isoform X1 [Drosophila nasuta]
MASIPSKLLKCKARNMLVKLLEEEVQALNNCERFNQIRIAFSNFHKDVKKLNTFNYFSGNEAHIKELQRRLIAVLLEHNLVEKPVQKKEEKDDDEEEEDGDDDEEEEDELVVQVKANCEVDQLRGIMMYLILNSAHIESVKAEHKLAECNPQCVHLLQQLPAPLAQLVTVSLALKCGLQQQFFEFLACAPHWLSVQYIDTLNETLTHLVEDHHEALPLLADTLRAVAKSLGYHAAHYAQQSACFGAQPELLLQATMRLLQRHLLYDEERLRLIRSSVGRHRYMGEAMKHLLDALLLTLSGEESFQLPAYFVIYALLSSPLGAIAAIGDAKALGGAPMMHTFASKLMDAVQRLLPQVSVDAYMTWHELPSGVPLFSLQTHINNQCAKLLQSLEQVKEKDSNLSNHSLGAQLTNFARSAQTFQQRLEQLTLGELLSFLDGDDESEAANEEQLLAALNQLMQRPIAFGSDECIESLAKHVQLLGEEHAHLIIDHLSAVLEVKQEQMESDEANYEDYDEIYGELLAKVLYPIFKALPTVLQKLRFLEKRDVLRLQDELSFRLSETSGNRIGFFNTLSYRQDEFPMLQFLDLCYEQPAETWLSLAQLGMTHPQFGKLYCNIAIACAAHAMHHLDYTLHQLMQDETLLTHKNSADEDDFLLRLYELPLVLHSPLRSPQMCLQLQQNESATLTQFTEQLQLGQRNYLSACSMGMEKFADAQNYAALGRLADTLLKLQRIEQRPRNFNIQFGGGQRRRRLAKKYATLMDQMSTWRISNWKLTFELIATIDKLRGQLRNFDAQRSYVLDQFMAYYVANMPRALRINPDMQQQVKALVETLTHKELWEEEQLIMLLPDIPSQAKDCALLLEKASSVEATNLLSLAILRKLDNAVLETLSRYVDDVGTAEAQRGYSFLLKAYMVAYKDVLIAPAKPCDYRLLAEHLMRTPKLLLQENLRIAIENLKTLRATDASTKT